MSLGKKKMLSQGAAGGVVARDNFDLETYVGNNSSRSFSNFNFQPDLIWFKTYSHAFLHQIYNSVRGANLFLNTGVGAIGSRTGTESEFNSSGGDLISFDNDGFSVGADVFGSVNSSGFDNIAWCWKAGGAAVSNTDGSITSQVSANTDAGFSISTFTSNASTLTVGHGLNSTPDLVIVKATSFTDSWFVNLIGLTNRTNRALRLNQSSGEETGSGFWNNTAPTSTTFSLGNGVSVSGQSYVAYCFHSVAGYSKIGSYTGTGGALTVYTTDNGTSTGANGFQPKFVMIKRADNTGNWVIIDELRASGGSRLYANLSNAEDAGQGESFVSNGFKPRQSSTADTNISGGTYIYMAFA